MPFTKSIKYLALNCQRVYLNRKNAVTAWARMTKTFPRRFTDTNGHRYVLDREARWLEVLEEQAG